MPIPPRVPDLQRYSNEQTPHMRHQSLRALPSYPPHPISSAYNPRVRSSADAYFSCAGCGAYFTPLVDERGVVQNSYCPECLTNIASSEIPQQHQLPRYQQRTRLYIDPATQQSPSKRGSWHAGSEFYPLPYPVDGQESVGAGVHPSSSSTSGPSIPRYASQNSYPATVRYSSTNTQSNSSDPLSTPPTAPSSAKNTTKTPSDPNKWESLRLAADSIIREKDSLIDKQRQQIQQLEQLARQAQQQSDQAEQQVMLARTEHYDLLVVFEMELEDV